MNEQIQLVGKLLVTLYDETGLIKEQRQLNNLIVQAGKNFLASAVIAASASPFSNLAIGTSGTAANVADTTLGAEIARQAATTGVVTNVATLATTYAAGVGTGAIQEAGIFNNAVAGTMLSHVVFATVNKAAGDTLTIQWTITLG